MDHVYNISPFGMKVESFLRVNKIPHEIVYTSKFGPKKKIPYLHLVDSDDGGVLEIIPDSNVILNRIEEIFQIPKEDLSREQEAISHMMIRMLEEHTAQIGFYYRYVLKSQDFMEKLDMGNRFFHADTSQMGRMIAPLFSTGMKKAFAMKMKARGLSDHSDEDLWKFSNDDLLAVSSLLGSKLFVFGDKQATRADCALFAHLAQLLYMPLDFPQKKFIEKECPNLVDFMERFRKDFWPDWDEKCQRQPNQRMLERLKSKRSSGSLVKKIVLPTILVAGVAYLLQRRFSH